MSALLGVGSYGVAEAARLADVPARTAYRWITGQGETRRGRVLTPDLPPIGDRRALSFLDLIDLLVVGRFRQEGVSLQTVRLVYRKMTKVLGIAHPFCHRRLLTDGKLVVLETLDEAGGGAGELRLKEVLSDQTAMPRILSPYLKQIDYANDTQTALRWHAAPGILIDPDRSFGKPVVADDGTTTFVLAAAYRANGEDVDLVADLFDVAPESVKYAVDFEYGLGGRTAA